MNAILTALGVSYIALGWAEDRKRRLHLQAPTPELSNMVMLFYAIGALYLCYAFVQH